MMGEARHRVLAAGVALSSVCGVLYAWSIFVLPLEQRFAWSRSETSFTFTVMMAFFAMGMFGGGALFKILGARLTVLAGGVVLSAGLACASISTSLTGLYLGYGVLAGFGVGVVNLVPTAVCLAWYPERKGLISGVLTMALAFGTLLFGTIGAGWLLGQTDAQTVFGIMAMGFPLFILPAAFFLRLPVRNHSAAAEAGLSLSAMLRTEKYWCIWTWMFCIQTGGLMIVGHIVPYALEVGLSVGQGAFAMGAYAVFNGLGRLLFGWVLDRFGRTASMLMDVSFMAVGLILLMILPGRFGLAGLLAGAIPVSMAFGGTIPQLAALVLSFFGPRCFSVNYGFSTTPLMVASVCGPFLGALVRAHTGSYPAALLAAVVVSALAVLPVWLLRREQTLC